ncbi:hypothetical protein JH25_27765 [Pseudomonas sp. BRG-100]|uniref:hypothetical protein n=1 Tax=Pseudomonas sp. BRG-100 TaxID=1524267 RepID=UPI0004E76E48|nr:hypothetical protein [Pseudomonas sp. BRG-100]KFF42168.1 hypothetical protein JH25_27765 [Pseudomonas sp. BRG-100]
MKPAKGLTDLAASLTAAASAPLVPPLAGTSPKNTRKAVAEGGTMQMTLRPARTLHALYVDRAAERSKAQGRTVTVQEIMLEVLEQGAKA